MAYSWTTLNRLVDVTVATEFYNEVKRKWLRSGITDYYTGTAFNESYLSGLDSSRPRDYAYSVWTYCEPFLLKMIGFEVWDTVTYPTTFRDSDWTAYTPLGEPPTLTTNPASWQAWVTFWRAELENLKWVENVAPSNNRSNIYDDWMSTTSPSLIWNSNQWSITPDFPSTPEGSNSSTYEVGIQFGVKFDTYAWQDYLTGSVYYSFSSDSFGLDEVTDEDTELGAFQLSGAFDPDTFEFDSSLKYGFTLNVYKQEIQTWGLDAVVFETTGVPGDVTIDYEWNSSGNITTPTLGSGNGTAIGALSLDERSLSSGGLLWATTGGADTGSETGTWESAIPYDSSKKWDVTESGGTISARLEFLYSVGVGSGSPSFTATMTGTGTVNLQVYNWGNTSWENTGRSLSSSGWSGTASSVTDANVGGGSNEGVLKYRLYGTSLGTSAKVSITQAGVSVKSALPVSFSTLSQSTMVLGMHMKYYMSEDARQPGSWADPFIYQDEYEYLLWGRIGITGAGATDPIWVLRMRYSIDDPS